MLFENKMNKGSVPMLFLLFTLLAVPIDAPADRVRKVTMKHDQIVQVKTSVGVATIIQVADAPTSLVVGDAESFKVEFLDQAITIKPLSRTAKSNLYIYTEYRRYGVQLVTVPEPAADYVVYLLNEPSKQKPAFGQKWKDVSYSLRSEAFDLRVKRTSQTASSGFLEIELTGSKASEVDPAQIWLTQGNSTVPIQRLVLSGFHLSKGNAVRGMIEILKADVNTSLPLNLEVRAKKKSFVQIPKVSLW